MNDKLPSREQALNLLIENGCSNDVIIHCKKVAELAAETAETVKKKGLTVDSRLVEVGALLHDIGRSKTHSVNHAVEGMKLAQAESLPDAVICIIKRHVGAGITAEEAEWLGWPKDNYVPQSLEEKIVCYADKCIGSDTRIPVEATIKQLHEQKLDDAAERVRKLHIEITHYLEA